MATTTARTRTREQLAESPEAAAQGIAEINSAIESTIKEPVIGFPPSDLVELPGGLIHKNKVSKIVQVKELTGRDEETLARTIQAMAMQTINPVHFFDRLLRCGVVKIGDFPESETENLLSKMLIGDREMLILGIRKATYGDDLEIPDWQCPACGVVSSLSLQISDIPVISLEDPEQEVEFDVPLRKGKTAHVRLATGEDDAAASEKSDWTIAQRESVYISRCVEYITDNDNVETYMRPAMALDMSMPDRHAILKELTSRQPGPKYNKISYKCESCNEDTFVEVKLNHLFLDFGWI